MTAPAKVKDPDPHTFTHASRNQRRHELLLMAHWIEGHFKLSARPKIHSASEAEVIYAHVLGRISELTAEG